MNNKRVNVMANIKIIEGLKAQLLCIIGEFFKLLTKGSNIAQNSILESLSSAIIVLYVLAERLGYSFKEVDDTMREKLIMGIKAEDEIEKEGKSLSQLNDYITNRID